MRNFIVTFFIVVMAIFYSVSSLKAQETDLKTYTAICVDMKTFDEYFIKKHKLKIIAFKDFQDNNEILILFGNSEKSIVISTINNDLKKVCVLMAISDFDSDYIDFKKIK